MKAEALKDSEIWWHSPPWLLEGKKNLPSSKNFSEPSAEYYDEVRATERPKSNLKSTGLVIEVSTPSVASVFDMLRYGNIKKLTCTRVTAFVLRFLKNLKSPRDRTTGSLSATEYKAAEVLWLREMQQAVMKSTQLENWKSAEMQGKIAECQHFI